MNFNVVLVHPEIPTNTGNIGRLCVATKSKLHIVGPTGFEITDRRLKRAGLDYWPFLSWEFYESLNEFWQKKGAPQGGYFFTKKAQNSYTQMRYRRGEWLFFGSESKGLSEDFLKSERGQMVRIPLLSEKVRSLNLSNAVAVTLFEGLRQLGDV